MSLQARLQSELKLIGLHLSDKQIEQLLSYLSLLAKWNKSYNLTAITDPEQMLYYHLLDSLSIVDHLKSNRWLLDVGSGAGLPGLPLAIVMPDSQWTLLDSNGKKTRFMQQAVAHCGIRNVRVVQSRVGEYNAPQPFDVIVSRAFSSLLRLTESVAHLWTADTMLLAMKTQLEPQERAAVCAYRIQEITLQVAGIAEKRSLIKVHHNNS